ncbi:hypothetical protein L2E82_02046 [Cichorium intybus]|uniref:Uncharacterized protein n=1 Tax=Cichorium intybus TaxID=13427 RepID=A0ACB9H0I1_CICIN|nr:hypothetical protein L2E82_02046 [Cichorium intybus]
MGDPVESGKDDPPRDDPVQTSPNLSPNEDKEESPNGPMHKSDPYEKDYGIVCLKESTFQESLKLCFRETIPIADKIDECEGKDWCKEIGDQKMTEENKKRRRSQTEPRITRSQSQKLSMSQKKVHKGKL